MLRKQDENQAVDRQRAERYQSGQKRGEQQKPEQQRGEQQKPEQQRGEKQRSEQQTHSRANNQGYNQNQQEKKQLHQQGVGQTAGVQASNNREVQGRNQSQQAQAGQDFNQGRIQTQSKIGTQAVRNQSNRQDAYSKESRQSSGFYRDRNTDRDIQPRQYAGASTSGGRHGYNTRNRVEETIEDIKEDIIRLEKEIELEIKEIKSLKL